MASKNFNFSKLASDVDTSGNILAGGIASSVSFGVDIYDSIGLLPYEGNTSGTQAFVNSNNRLYIWQGSGWYNVALINRAPSISSVQDSDGNTTPFTLSSEGVVTTITITAADSDGDPITYSATADSDFNGLGSIAQEGNEFTITPFSEDSASTTSGTITFKATDGVNIASSGVQTFTLGFLSPLWDETVLSIGTSSTNSLDNSTFIDRSTNAHTVTPTGSPVQTAFHPYLDNWSVEFDGTGDYLQMADSDDFHIGAGDFTLEGWLYKKDKGSWSSLISQRAGATSEWRIMLDFDGSNNYNEGYFRFEWGASSLLIVDAGIPNNAWTHFALVRSGNTGTLYINGTSVDTDTLNDISNFSAPLQIGTNDGAGEYYLGYISNLRLVKGTALYTANFTPPTENLTAVSGTVLLTCQSNRFIDNSASAHAITVNGDPEISAVNPFGQGSEYAAGENKGSFVTTNGDTNLLTIPHDTSLNLYSGDYTVQFWVWLDAYSTSGNVISKGGNSSREWGFSLTSNTIVAYWSTNGSSSGDSVISATGLTNNLKEWIHVAFVKSGSTVKIYKNGEQVGSGSFTSIYAGSGTAKVARFMDYTGISHSLVGQIADLKLIKGTAVYTTDFTPPTAPVGNTNASLYLPMDNAGVFDKTGNNTLTLFGNASTSTTQTKYADTAMYFDGTGDYLKVSASEQLAFGTGDFTIECWVYKNASNAYMTLGGNASTGSESNKYQLVSSADGTKIGFYMTGNFRVVSTSTIPTSTWTHVAYVRSSGVLYIYINGVQEDSAATTENLDFGEFWVGQIPALASGRDWNGYIENLQILKGLAKYTSNFTVPDKEQGRTYQAED